ncbi:MAG: hypothetical protein HY903_15205 [Deltaproteobacteria bacterium]|nr:hypothetical protein [Deltaproteobacteria bacterium]
MVPTTAWGLTVEPGSIIGSAALGPGFRLGSALGASGAYLLVNAQGEYAFDKSLSAVAGLNLGVSGSVPLRLRAGARYRLADLDLPVSPFAQAQLSFGRIWDVIGANLTTLGAYLGAGADYFLTAKLSVGGQVGVDLSTTMGQRPAFLGMVEIVAFGSYVF